MEYILSGFWSLLELIVAHFLWGAFLEVKGSKWKYICIFVSSFLFGLIILFIGIPDIYEQTISIVMFTVVIATCFYGTFLKKILFVLLLFITCGILDTAILYGTCAVLGMNLSELVWRKIMYSIVVSVSKLISLFLAWLLFRFRRIHSHQSIRRTWLLLTIPFPAVSLGMLAIVFHSNRDTGDLSIGSACFSVLLSASNIAIIYLFDLMERTTAASKKAALLNQQMEIQTSAVMALEKNYRAQRKATHEYRNQLQTIHDLLATGQQDAAQTYICQLQGMQTTRIFTVNSHHPIIDAVLNQKYQQAQENNIDVEMEVSDLSCVSIATDHLVVLLSNLLNNAIEACNHLPNHRTIQCSIILTDSLYLSVRNTSLPVQIRDNFIPTTKEPKEDHGYGLPHIDFILNQLNAEYALSYRDGWFEFAAEIPHS